MATSYGLASFETRRTYDNMEQHVRDVLRGHFPQEDLVKKGEEVFELAEELTMYSLLKNSPNQAVSPDYYLKSMGVALGTACRKYPILKFRHSRLTFPYTQVLYATYLKVLFLSRR